MVIIIRSVIYLDMEEEQYWLVDQQLVLDMVGLGKVGLVGMHPAAVLGRVAVEWGRQLTAGWDKLTVA